MSKIAFDILSNAYAIANGYQALPYAPNAFVGESSHEAEPFDEGEGFDKKKQSVTGATLRKYKNGVYYFMPVVLSHKGKKWEFDDALVSITGKKTIVKTPLVGRKGVVKELISLDDYEIKLVVVVQDEDYPEKDMQELVRLYEINESINMNCVVTDYFLQDDDKVVIESMDTPAMVGYEDMQIVTFKLLSDQNFELEI